MWLNLQGSTQENYISLHSNYIDRVSQFLSACCLIGLLFDPVGGGSTFLQTLTKYLHDYMASQFFMQGSLN
jgi:hypothetical protein